MQIIPRFDLLKSPLAARNLLEASAGTGKTFTIAALYLRLLLETDLTVDRILVVTFTEAATEELRDRIRQRIREAFEGLCGEKVNDLFLEDLLGSLTSTEQREQARAKLREALICFDEAAIYTIHGFCQRILQDKAFEAGALFDTELITDQTLLLDEIAQDFWRQRCANHAGPFASYLFEKKIVPASFTEVLKQVTGDPGIAVIPERGNVDLTTIEREWQNQREGLRKSWQTHRSDIKELLLSSEGLNRGKYRQTSLVKWFDEIDDYFSSETAFQAPEKLFERFTVSALIEGKKKGAEPPQHPFFDLCEEAAENYTRIEVTYSERIIALKVSFIRYLRLELPHRKKVQNIRHFDDLLLDVRDRLTSSVGPRLCDSIRSQFKAAFIDEFQDTDPVQFEIFRKLYPDKKQPVFFIGDPKQAIYSFRGADIFAYIAATKVVEHRYTLSTNWRSTPELVRAINTVFAAHDRPFVFEEITFQPVDQKKADTEDVLTLNGITDPHPLQIWTCDPLEAGKADNVDVSRQRLAQAVSNEIARLLNLSTQGEATIKERPLAAGDIAVLVRTHKEGALVEKTLKMHNIPSVQSGTGSLFDTREAQEVMRVLRAIADPVNESLVKAALTSDLFGVSGDDLGAMISDEKLLEVWLDEFLEYNRIWQSRNLIVMTGKLFAGQTVRRRLLGLPDGQRRLTNLLHCFEVLHKAAQEQHLGIDGLLKWFSRQFEAERGQEEYQIRLESDDNAVKIVTIHKSKGLEYPIVFCPFCWNSAKVSVKAPLFFHNSDEDNQKTMDLGSEDLQPHAAIAEREQLAEQMRLLYVAMTRAKYRCYVGWGQFKSAEKSSLGYLLHAQQQPTDGSGLAINYPATLESETIASDLAHLAKQADGGLLVEALPEQNQAAYTGEASPQQSNLKAHDFTGRIDRSWCVSSFSNLTAGPYHPHEFHAQEKNWTRDESDLVETNTAKDSFASFMDFPKGATAGSCLHMLFENLDFCATNSNEMEQVARSALKTFDLDLRWVPAVMGMVERTLASPIITPEGSTLRLNQISRQDQLAEMEFLLPLGSIESTGLARLFAKNSSGRVQVEGFSDHLSELGFTRHHGMLLGFIDLIFRHEGRYYLLDWKSNFLGTRAESYRPEALAAAMKTSCYTLQYHLYLVALHRYLNSTLPDYAYATHFGGVVYAYLRGTALNESPDASLGIFNDYPDLVLVEALANYLAPGKETA